MTPERGPRPVAIDVRKLQALTPADRAFFFVLENSPPGCGRSSFISADGAMRLSHEIEGTIVCHHDEHLDLGTPSGIVRLKTALPSGLSLSGLLSRPVVVRTVQILGDRAGIDLRIRDPEGRLLLWAFDGALPGGDALLSVQASAGAASTPPLLRIRDGRGAEVEAGRALVTESLIEDMERRVVVLRVGADDASFLVV